MKYLTGYLVEKSLSVDNIFVISMIFAFLAVPAMYQHRVLFWGIVGALLMRGVMIAVGAAMIQEFTWIIYVFGGFLILTGVKMLVVKGDNTDPHSNIVVRLTRRLFPITQRFHGQHFFVRAGSGASHEAPTPGAENLRDDVVESAPAGTLLATPLFLGLVMVEFTDLIFAVDSIPAIFAITADPFLVYHEQRVRDTRTQEPLLCAGGNDREVQVSESLTCAGADAGGGEDDDARVAEGNARQQLQPLSPRGGGPDPRGRGGGIPGGVEKERVCRLTRAAYKSAVLFRPM